VTETKSREAGAAIVTLALPSSLLPDKSFDAPIHLVVATHDGQYVGHGAFLAISRIWGGLIASALTGLLFWWLSTARHGTRLNEMVRAGLTPNQATWMKDWKQRFSSLFIGADNEPSLSLFQIFIWTVITVWGLLYVYIVTGSLLSLTTEMMALLGIAGAGSVLARWISTSGADGSSRAASTTPKRTSVSLWEILSSDGRFDLLKLQLLVFTLTIAIYVVWRIADTAAFPALDTNTLLLLGVSQGVYIGGKLAGSTPLSRAQTAKLDLDLKSAQLQALKDEEAALTSRQNDLKARTPPEDLPTAEKDRLAALPALKTAKEKEIAEAKTAWEKGVAELGLKPA
jgi:hypothetical protein